MKNLLLLFIVLCFLSCTTGKLIHIKNDGSAIIKMEPNLMDSDRVFVYNPDTIKARFSSREIISKVSYSQDSIDLLLYLKSIDSIGNFMGVFNNDYFNFKFYPDSLLIIKTTDIFPFKQPEFKACCDLYMHIEFDRTIRNVCTTTKGVKWKKKDNTIIIGLGNGDMRKNKNPLELKVYL